MDKFLESISLANRVIFLRRYWFCETYAEIAVRYGISERKVKRKIHRIRAQLSDYLNKAGIPFGMSHIDVTFVREAESVTILREEKWYLFHSYSILINLADYVFNKLFCCPNTKLYERS